jgi:penicillin-binding protein 2
LVFRLYQLTGLQGSRWTAEATENTIKTILTDAPRGEIYDRNGVLLAGNHSSFAINISRNDMTNEEINLTIQNLLSILETNEETVINNFPIILSEGQFSYKTDAELAQWLSEQQMPENFTAEDAFGEIRRRYGIVEGLDRYEAQSELITKYNVNVPISVKKMEFNKTREKRDFLNLFSIEETNISAEAAFKQIRKDCKIDKALSNEEAVKILNLRYELLAQGYMRYLPVEVARGVSQKTVVEIEENLHNLIGVSVITQSVRYYPEGTAASHVIGYLGKISDDNKEEYVKELGYRGTDLIGQYGIEKSEEDILKGTYGIKKVQINKKGEILSTIGKEVIAKKGEDIALTIDIEYQKMVKDILDYGLSVTRSGGTYSSRFGNYSMKAHNAQVGAVVVVDVKTGEPLAIANSQEFDPNLFAQGITTENWNALQGDNPRDPLSPRPLYDVATRTAVQPGSCFKPMTAIAALGFGLNPNRVLVDAGFIEMGDHIYSCMAWNTYGHTHGGETLRTALRDSCNFYFFDAATGRDWANGGADMGYANQITIDGITEYAKQFGLGIKSDIEIEETVVDAPTAESKRVSTENLLRNYLIGQCEYIFTEEALQNKNKVLESIDEIVSWTAENPTIKEIKERLIPLGIKEDEAQGVAEETKFTYYNYAEWTTGDVFNVAIGQGETAFTTLQMANYTATIGNMGVKNSSSLLLAKESVGSIDRPAGTPAALANAGNLSEVIEGMKLVVTSGTLRRGLGSLPVSVAGKSGTAQRAGFINPPDEVAYMQEHLGSISPGISWEAVQAEMQRLMEDYPTVYNNPNNAVRKAVVNLSGRNFDKNRLDMFKSAYDDFGWVIAMAPAEDPQIAVACMFVQGGGSESPSPVVRDAIGTYFELQAARAAGTAAGSSVSDWNEFFADDHLEE